MIKKFLFGVILSVMMISSLSGCGKTDDKSESYKNNTESGADIDLFKNKDDKKETLIKEDAEDTILDDFRTEPNTPEELAYVAYEEYLNDGSYGEITSYEFVYIDDDDIPELVMVPGNGCLALSYHNGEVVQLCYSSATFFDYVERQGYFRYGGMYREDYYGRLSSEQVEVVAYYNPVRDTDGNYTENKTYYLGSIENSKEVSKDEYDAYISSLGDFTSLLDDGIKYTSMYDAYKALVGISDEETFSEDEAWKEAYYNSYEFYDDVTTEYYIVDPNNDGIPEVIMEDVDGAKKIFYLDKFNTLRDLGWGYPIYEGASGCIYIGTEISPQQIMNNAVFTEYDYSEETGTWVANNQLEIALDDDWEERLPGGYDNSEGQLFKDSDYCSYKVNGKDYSSYEEAANAFSKEYAGGAVQEINTYNGNYKSYNYNQFKQAILDYGLETYEPLMYQVTKFEFKDGRLDVVADNAPKLENDSLQSFEISYPIAADCKWYSKFEGNIEGITTYDYICKCQQERRNDYDTLDKIGLTMGEASFFLGIKVKDGVIVEIYLDYAL